MEGKNVRELTCLARRCVPELLDTASHLLCGPGLSCLLVDVLGDELVAVREPSKAAWRLGLCWLVLV